MKKYTKEEKVRITEQFLVSEGWEWFKQELEDKLIYFEPAVGQNIDVNTRIFQDGVIAGIRFCLKSPERINKENDSYVRRLYAELLEGKHGS